MSTKKDVLKQASFGSRVAEEEAEGLKSYFVETEQWRRILAGDVDIVFGAKGAGKSALYSLLVAQKEMLRLGRRTVLLPAENPRGTPAFRDLTADPPASEDEFRGLWKLYFLALVAHYLRHQLTTTGTTNDNAAIVIEALTKSGLLPPDLMLTSRLKSILAYLRRNFPALEGTIKEPHTGVELNAKIVLAPTTPEQTAAGIYSVDELVDRINAALRENQIVVWLVLDRLDVAFSESSNLEGNALRSLFRVYLDMQGLSNIDIKIFLRDDIWEKVVENGFREASHVTKTLTLTWDHNSLLNLIVRRVLPNPGVCAMYGVEKNSVLENAALQNDFFYRVFPRQVDVGQSRPSTLDWMMSRTADGTRRTAPRELIHLLLEMRDEQLKLYELGNAEPQDENLFDRMAIRTALPAVSNARYKQTLCAEHPSLKSYLDRLEKQRTQQTKATLARIWSCNVADAFGMAERATEAGFFERKGTRDNPTYWVPFLYRAALKMRQGAA